MANIQVRNPATGRDVSSVPITDIAGVADAARRAREAQKSWARLPFTARASVVRLFHDRILSQPDRVLDPLQAETGKTRRDALAELVTVAGTARYYLANGEHYLSPDRRQGAIPLLAKASVLHRPHGVVGLIVPWNYPFLLSIADAIPALLAGNAVVFKPSDLTPLSAVAGRDILVECGMDADLLGIVQGGADVGAELIRNVNYLGFTGSSANGRKVAVAAAERLIPFSLELGGKNPMVVLKEAPLELAAKGLLAGAFSNSGQTCISIERVYVESPVFDKFARLVADGAAKLKLGYSASWDLDMGSMIHSNHAAGVQEKIDRAVEGGATVIAGGKRRPDLGAAFVEPTVLKDVPVKAPIEVTETFGPVVSLHRVSSPEEAVALANDSEYGLNASIWAGNSAAGMRLATQIEAGTVGINSTLMVYNTFDVPMGGIKQSGIGRRHGEYGILRYTQPQSIVTSFASGGGYDGVLLSVRSQKMASALLKAVRWWRRIPGLS